MEAAPAQETPPEDEMLCSKCGWKFMVSKEVLKSREVDICMRCFRKSNIKLHQDQVNSFDLRPAPV